MPFRTLWGYIGRAETACKLSGGQNLPRLRPAAMRVQRPAMVEIETDLRLTYSAISPIISSPMMQ